MQTLRRLTFLCVFWPFILHAQPSHSELSVWVNEAIVATYTYDFQNFIPQQRTIARYFSSEGWLAYSHAINKAHLPETVQKNNYFVSAVAQMPPHIINSDSTHWQASMPVLVVYKNPQYQQKQMLNVKIYFSTADTGQGVRGLVIDSLQANETAAPCVCQASNPPPDSTQ